MLLFVGRFTEVKRVGLLIESFARARERFATRAPLVLLGGFPGEWEGEHPLDTIRRVGAQDVFLAGWHEHEELPDFLSASDAVVLPSVREQFGQVLVEGMACELPASRSTPSGRRTSSTTATRAGSCRPTTARRSRTALVDVVNDPAERRRRGRNALTVAHERYAWPALARRVADVYADAARKTVARSREPAGEGPSGRSRSPLGP